jgi:sugar lactone lactonase YvrE
MILLLGTTLAALGAPGCGDSDDTPANNPEAGTGGSGGSGGGGTGGGGTGGGETGGSLPEGGTGGAETDGPTGDGPTDFKPSLLIDLPETCNTPDGMRLDKKGNVILSCPNFFGMMDIADGGPDAGKTFSAPPVLMKITPANKLEPYFSNLPVPPNAPGRAGPMGIDFGPDGNLYVADHQYRYDTNYKSRVIRVTVDPDGNPTGADVVVEGIRLSNAVMWHGDYLYLTDTWAYNDPPVTDGGVSPTNGWSAIYRFSKTELAAANSGSTIKVTPPTATSADPHLFLTLKTEAGRGVNMAGADGITFDDAGNLYTGNFGDGVITKVTFDADGGAATQMTWVKDPVLTCADGIFFDKDSKNIYVADSRKNAIRVLSPAGVVSTLWENDNSDGTGGLLDQPAEPTIRGNDLIIANFDAGFNAAQLEAGAKNPASEPPHTISVIKLK